MKHLSRCRGCDASVWWAITEKNGKFIPLDPDPSPDGNLRPTGEDRTTDRGRVPVVAHAAAGSSGELYMPHHATCPSAKYYSKDRARRACDRALDKGRRT